MRAAEDVNARAVRRDVRDSELDVRSAARPEEVPVRTLLGGLTGLRSSLARRARITGDPTRFDDDVEAVEDYFREQVSAALRGRYATQRTLVDVLADDELLGEGGNR